MIPLLCFDRMDEYVEHLLAAPGHVDQVMTTHHLDACSACAEEVQSLLEPAATAE